MYTIYYSLTCLTNSSNAKNRPKSEKTKVPDKISYSFISPMSSIAAAGNINEKIMEPKRLVNSVVKLSRLY